MFFPSSFGLVYTPAAVAFYMGQHIHGCQGTSTGHHSISLESDVPRTCLKGPANDEILEAWVRPSPSNIIHRLVHRLVHGGYVERK